MIDDVSDEYRCEIELRIAEVRRKKELELGIKRSTDEYYEADVEDFDTQLKIDYAKYLEDYKRDLDIASLILQEENIARKIEQAKAVVVDGIHRSYNPKELIRRLKPCMFEIRKRLVYMILDKTTLYNIKSRYYSMMQRCYNKKDPSYKNYGGRGITVCKKWRENLDAYVVWAVFSGYSPVLEIDRINNNKGYFPSNCRWVTRRVNLNNTRAVKHYRLDGKIYTVTQLAELTGTSRNMARKFLKLFGTLLDKDKDFYDPIK